MGPSEFERVVLIDDSEPDLLYARIVLERSGLVREVVAFEAARDALAWLTAPGAPAADMILLDINMPVMNGFEFLAAYEAALPQRPVPAVVMLTSSSDPQDRRQAQAFACVRGFVTKPLDADEVRRLIGLLGS